MCMRYKKNILEQYQEQAGKEDGLINYFRFF